MADTGRGSTNTIHPPSGGLVRTTIALVLTLALLAGAMPANADGSHEAPQDPHSRSLPAPPLGLASSQQGKHVAVSDEDGRYTFLLDTGERERSWSAPAAGLLALIDPSIGEVEPRPVGVTMTPDGDHWAGATAYSGNFGGRVDGFAHWSDEPIWTFQLPDAGADSDAVQPTVIASGGKYHAVGTTQGKVHLLEAGGEQGSDKSASRTYKESNTGVPFGAITDVAVSEQGTRYLIGTDTDGSPSLHLFTDIFFKATFKRITAPVKQVALSDDGTRGAAVTGSGDNARVHFLDTEKGTTLWEHTIGSSVRSLSLSQTGSLLAVGSASGRVNLYEEQGGIMDNVPRQVFSFDSTVTSLSAADDGRAVVAATENGRVYLIDLDRSKPLWSYEVSAPAVAVSLSGDQAMLVVGSVSGDEGRVTYLEAKHDIEHMLPPAPRLMPGQTQALPVELANNGNRMATVHVDWRSLPNHWEGHETNLSLAPGESGTLDAGLTLPPGQPEGDYELQFDLVTDALSVPVTVTARVPQVTSGQSTQLWSFERAVPGGAPAAFLIKLVNTGNTMNELALGYSGLPSGWDAEFTGSQETKLRPGEDRQVALTVHAPPSATIGDEVWLDLVIAWQHGEERHPLRIELVDQDTYSHELNALTNNSDAGLPDVEGMAELLERLNREADQPVAMQGDGSTSTALIPAGGLVVPLGAIAVALALTSMRVRRRDG